MAGSVTAAQVVEALEAVRSEAELPKVRTRLAPDEPAIGMRMRDLFDTAKAYRDLPLAQIDQLLDHPAYEPRMAAMCILDFAARGRLDDEARRERFELYLRRHDRISTWDMVDRAAPRVVGRYLADRSPEPLTRLAGSTATLERRTAITAPLYFVKDGSDADLDHGFAVAAQLAADPEPAVSNAVGIFLKHAGRRAPNSLHAVLDAHAATMPRPALRLAIEQLDPAGRARYLG